MSKNRGKQAALRFVIFLGVVSFFADFTYEGSRSIVGPYLAAMGASGTVVGVIAGVGEFLGYGLRLVSGPLSERTGKFWPITLVGYFVQMLSVPALALTRGWPSAAALIIAERVGKAIRNPPRDVMLSQAGRLMGFGWAFGLHEAMDQLGALCGPLLVAMVLYRRHSYPAAFLALALPAGAALATLLAARMSFPNPGGFETSASEAPPSQLPRVFWLYLGAAALISAGFPDFPLMAYHLAKSATALGLWVPILYSLGMAASGLGSLIFGRLFDLYGLGIIVPLTIVAALATPLVFLGNFWVAALGIIFWGLGLSVHESLVPAAVALIVPESRRGSAYGIFTAGYGTAWLLGSVAIGALYDRFFLALIYFSVLSMISAIPLLLMVRGRIISIAREDRQH